MSSKCAKMLFLLFLNFLNSNINFSISSKLRACPSSTFCQICLTENLFIIKFVNGKDLLNKKSELNNKCRYLNKFLLVNVNNK